MRPWCSGQLLRRPRRAAARGRHRQHAGVSANSAAGPCTCCHLPAACSHTAPHLPTTCRSYLASEAGANDFSLLFPQGTDDPGYCNILADWVSLQFAAVPGWMNLTGAGYGAGTVVPSERMSRRDVLLCMPVRSARLYMWPQPPSAPPPPHPSPQAWRPRWCRWRRAASRPTRCACTLRGRARWAACRPAPTSYSSWRAARTASFLPPRSTWQPPASQTPGSSPCPTPAM